MEIIESEFPTQVERFELLRDSGGRGRHRGGLGFVREYRILQDEVRFSMRTDKHALAPQGIDGGHPASTGDCIINPGGEDEGSLALPLRRSAAEKPATCCGWKGPAAAAWERPSSGVRRPCWMMCGKGTFRWSGRGGTTVLALRYRSNQIILDPDGTRVLRGSTRVE